jgi:hypothetical protein
VGIRYQYIRRNDDVPARLLHDVKPERVTGMDPGTIHAYLFNGRDRPLDIRSILLNGSEPGQASDLAYWAQAVPNPVAPGMVSDVMVKLKGQLVKGGEVRLTFADTGTMGFAVQPSMPEVRVTYVGFSPDRRKVYLYCRNLTQRTVTIHGVELRPPGRTLTPSRGLPSLTIGSGELTCVVLTLDRPLAPGQYVWCGVKTSGQLPWGEQYLAGCTMARVYTRFPIQAFASDHRPELSFDADNFEMAFPESEGGWKSALRAPWYKAYHVYDDPVCADGAEGKSLGSTALEVAARAEACRRRDPVHPTMIYMCEFMKPASYFVYGEITDVVAIDPYSIVHDGATPWRNKDYMALAKAATEPRPLVVFPEAFMARNGSYVSGRYPTPEEERLSVYLQLAYGAKGIWYFMRESDKYFGGYDDQPALRDEIGRLNSELRILRPYLQMGEPVEWAKSLTSDAEAHAVLCGDQAVVVVVLNRLWESWPRYLSNPLKPGTSPFSYKPAENVTVAIAMPETMRVRRAFAAVAGERREVPFEQAGGEVRVEVGRVDLATALVLQL